MPTKKEFVATDLTEEEIRKVRKDWPEGHAQPHAGVCCHIIKVHGELT